MEPRRFGERFGHVLPVVLLEGDLDRYDRALVSDGLRSMLGVMTRLYNITAYGGDVERLLGNESSAVDVRGGGDGGLWTEHEYEMLFGQFPPDGARPSQSEVAAIAAELGRTQDAISWQWSDGSAYVDGRSASTTSEVLKRWLDRRGAR